MDPRLEALPGGDFVAAGIDDLARGVRRAVERAFAGKV
jgi:hypothetical protein